MARPNKGGFFRGREALPQVVSSLLLQTRVAAAPRCGSVVL